MTISEEYSFALRTPSAENVGARIEQNFSKTLHLIFASLKRFTLFHIAFLALLFSELIAFAVLFLFSTSLMLAFCFALLFFTLFAYLTLSVYLSTKKEEKLTQIRNNFIRETTLLLANIEGPPLSSYLRRMAETLQGKEYGMFPFLSYLGAIGRDLEAISAWWYWKDFHTVKELFLNAYVEEHFQQVLSCPTSLDAHAALANAYVLLSSLYSDPRKWQGTGEKRYVPKKAYADWVQQKFQRASELAIEEFKILQSFAPNDPWVHMQLAYSYRDLNQTDMEIKEFETVVRLKPSDSEAWLHLGILYFSAGANAKGFQVYETLRKMDEGKALVLIQHYSREI